jgi:hypothetical protein
MFNPTFLFKQKARMSNPRFPTLTVVPGAGLEPAQSQ